MADDAGSALPKHSPRLSLGLEDASAYAVQRLLRQLSQDGFRLKVMVVGESGLGKTTLIDTLFRTTVNLNSQVDTPKLNAKTVRIEKRECSIVEGGVSLNLSVIDTPGYGDAINNEDAWLPVLDYILVELQSYFEREQDVTRKGDVIDTRVHACLYFLAPHRMKDVDVEFMKRLHQCVNLIPVIAKADTMTTNELAEYKQLIIDRLKQNEIRTYPDLPMGPLADEGGPTSPPFAVIGSNERIALKEPGLPELELPAGSLVNGRSYPWGDACIEDPRHCDVGLLRKVIVTEFVDLQRATHEIYQEFRSKELGNLKRIQMSARNKLFSFMIFVSTIILVTVMCFFYPLAVAYTFGGCFVILLTLIAGILTAMVINPKVRDDLSMSHPTAVTVARYVTCNLINETRHDRRQSYMALASATNRNNILWPLMMPIRRVIHRFQRDAATKMWKLEDEDESGPHIVSPGAPQQREPTVTLPNATEMSTDQELPPPPPYSAARGQPPRPAPPPTTPPPPMMLTAAEVEALSAAAGQDGSSGSVSYC